MSRNAAGTILINGGAVKVLGGTPTVANTSLMQIFGQDGDDVITIDESNGALPRSNIFGGAGKDIITGGSGADMIFGQAGDDVLLGKGGRDDLFGGAGNDTITGGDGDDRMFGEGGDDRLIWNPGDDTDVFEGGAGLDTAEVNGGNGTEQFTVTANGTRVRFDRLDPAPFSLDIGTTENAVVNMNGGDDRFSATGNLAALIKLTVDGGAGNDTILGSNGNDQLLGGDGNDFIDGQQGNDAVLLGAGDDAFQWDPGDGNDLVEGQDGTDTMLFNGSAGNEAFEASANGQRVLFTRNIGSIVMDLNDLEVIDLKALGGTDSVTVNDLSGTDVQKVQIDLAGAIGGTAGDGAADTVNVNASDGGDIIDVFGAGSSLSVLGLPALVSVTNSEGANDHLVIRGLGGNDRITATTLLPGIAKLTLDGGAGDDTILGSQGSDSLIGGDGNDSVFGDNGNDVAQLSAGNDTFQWDPGDGNDTIEGGDGTDTMRFNGSNVSENINILANGGRALFTRDVANVTMDLNDVETIDFKALGGADNIVVSDLSGTDVKTVVLDLAGPGLPQGDGAADSVTVNATNGADTVSVTGSAGNVDITGTAAAIEITGAEGANDTLTVNGLGGNDVLDAAGLEAGVVKLTMNGGLGDDTFHGSAGDDFIGGGDGNDLALMGAGDDTFVWNPGDDNDVLEGQAGTDTMLFNGAVIAEKINISANGERALFTRDIANVVMDLNDVEVIDFNALGGTDSITVGDLSGTDVQDVRINLAGTIGGTTGDGAADTITIDATGGDDVILVVGDNNGGVTVLGLSAEVHIFNFDIGDRLVINGLGGDDVVEASGFISGLLQLTAEGGDGDDILIGGVGADVLLGGNGDDVLIGGGGLDILNGGSGDNIII